MIDFKDVVKAERAKERARVPAASDPGGNGKTPAELEKEILENHEAILKGAAKEARAKEAKVAKEQEAIEAREAIEAKEKPDPEDKIYTTKKPREGPVLIACPFCGEEKSAQGMGRHIAAIHKVPGINIQDLDDVKKGLKSLEDLVAEKFPEGEAEIFNISPEAEKKHFSDWEDMGESPEDPEDLENPEGSEDPEDLGDPEILEDPEKEAKEKGASGGISPVLFWIVTIGGIVGAALLRDPKYKEKGENLLAYLGGLGSKKTPQSPGKKSYAQHAIDINKARNNK